MKRIPLSVPNVCGNEQKYVDEALRDGWISSVGSYVNKFEEKVAEYAGVQEAVAVGSGTAGLHLAYKEAGVQSGDLVVVPTLTFIASVNPIRYQGAEPYFIDCDDTLCLDPKKLETFLENECEYKEGIVIHTESGKVVRAVVVVHIFGNLANMEALCTICHKYSLPLIEDACEALGTKDSTGKMAGTFGDYGVYSFNGNKIISTGGGGIVVSNHEEHLKHIRFLSTQAKTDSWYFVHDEVGYNYRLTNISAAIGVGQLELLEGFITRKEQLYNLYRTKFEEVGLKMMDFRKDTRSNRWFFSLLWEKDYGMDRHQLMRELKEVGIETRPIWGLIHHQKPYQHCLHGDLAKSEYYIDRIVNIPCSTSLTDEEALYVIQEIIQRKG
ncbi:MAG: LegC family aminotransferase [Erysipelotrichaceae bacterium]|nr:LegC family aminotransferase [Erysipelotrichaceae bacterium]